MTTRRQALISVSDKTGIAELAKTFVRFGIELLSTGGTARLLKDAGIVSGGNKGSDVLDRIRAKRGGNA